MSLPRDLVRSVRRLDEHQLKRLLILARGLLIGSEGALVEPSSVHGVPDPTYRQQWVRCGRDCGSCPHGPYWYAYWREGRRTRSQYIGRELPAAVRRRCEELDAAGEASSGEPGG